VVESSDVAGIVIVVVPLSARCGSTEIDAGDMKPMSVNPANVTAESTAADVEADQSDVPIEASRKSVYEMDVAIYKQKSSNAGESDSVSVSETFTSCMSQSPAGNDTVFCTPPAHVSGGKTTNDSASPAQQQRNEQSLEDTAKVPSESTKVMIYRRSDSSFASEKRYAGSECSQNRSSAQERADEDGIDCHCVGTEAERSEEPVVTGDNKETDSDANDAIDSDNDINNDVSHSEGRADEQLDQDAAVEKMTADTQENKQAVSMSTTEKKKRTKKRKNKKNKQQDKRTPSTAVAKSVSSSAAASATDNLESLPITRPPPPMQPESTNTDGNSEDKCAQTVTSTGTREMNSAAESTERFVARSVRENVDTNVNPLSSTQTAEKESLTYADAVASGANNAVNHQMNQETDKCNEQKHLKAGALGCSPDIDSANVPYYTRSHSMSKSEKKTDGDGLNHYNESSENVEIEKPPEHRQINTDMSMENKTSDTKATNTKDAASHQGSSQTEVCIYCFFYIIG